jgi:hypothetical protein
VGENAGQVSRPAAIPGFTIPGEAAQIIENLVGCSKEELVSTLSKPETIVSNFQMRV